MTSKTRAHELIELRGLVETKWGATPRGYLEFNGKLSLAGILIQKSDTFSSASTLTTVRNICEIVEGRPVSLWEEHACLGQVLALIDTALFALKTKLLKDIETGILPADLERIRRRYKRLCASRVLRKEVAA